jgi:hypothetical protein
MNYGMGRERMEELLLDACVFFKRLVSSTIVYFFG